MTADRDQCDCLFRIKTIVSLKVTPLEAPRSNLYCWKQVV